MPKTILVTGSSTGIGAATAIHLAKDNEIIVHYNASQKEANSVVKKVEAAGGKAHLLQADVSTESGCRKIYEFVSQKIGKLDVLINNAGGLIKRQVVKDIEWEVLEKTFALNVFSVMKLSSLFLPLLEKSNDPCIVNITSIAMRHGAPTATAYGAAKGAIDSFTRGMAVEHGPHIRINAVAPGVIDTPYHERHSTPERLVEVKNRTPLKKIGTSEDVAIAIKMLIDNRFITGETIDVNGGLFMR